MAIRFALFALSVSILAAPAAGQTYTWETLARLSGSITGLALDGSTLVTWSDRIEWRTLPSGAVRAVIAAGRSFGEGGCLLDVDGDGRADLVVNEDRPLALAWYGARDGARHVIDTGVDSPDVIPATLFGQRGVLLIHKRMEIRFYSIPSDPAQPWPVRDLYSIYTPSWQGGLALADVDRDGRTDIICGNYWIRSPERFDLPWRLFAINTWTEQEPSGVMRLAWNGTLAAAQRLLSPARAACFERPADPREQWTARDLGAFDRPNSIETAGGGFFLAENGGAGRVVTFRAPDCRPREVRRGAPVRYLRALPDGRLILVTAAAIEIGAPSR